MTVPVTEKLSARYIMAGAALISFSGVYVKWAHVAPTVSGFYRVLIGGIILVAMGLYRREPRWVDVRYFGLQVFCGLIFALDMFVWHKSIIYIGPGLATILANFQVFVLALIGVAVLKERLNPRLLVAIPTAMLGLFLVVGIQWHAFTSEYRAGVLLGLITALCYTGYTLSLRGLQRTTHRLPLVSNLAVVSLASSVFLGLLALGEGASFGIPDLRTLGALSAYGVLCQVLGWVLISKGLPGVRASLVGLLLLFQPSLAFIWDILFFESQITPMKLTGTAIVLFAIYLGSARSK